MRTLEEVQQELKDLGVFDLFGTKKEVKELPKILHDDEVIKYATSGLVDGNTWLITCTNKRVIFLDKGMLFGLKQIETPLDKINSIQQKIGLLLGEIHIWDGASKTEIKNCAKNSVKPFVDAVNKAIDALKQSSHQNISPATNNTEDDFIEKLERLSQLKQDGILSEEEFIKMKDEIINS